MSDQAERGADTGLAASGDNNATIGQAIPGTPVQSGAERTTAKCVLSLHFEQSF
jgi:hypothetical protein